ncbi:MAG TPA: hypothetical protein DCP91_11585 [Eggerthellaceae bacterium]|nr:hypothetical protein [Eggerthellaceae bacterium]
MWENGEASMRSIGCENRATRTFGKPIEMSSSIPGNAETLAEIHPCSSASAAMQASSAVFPEPRGPMRMLDKLGFPEPSSNALLIASRMSWRPAI